MKLKPDQRRAIINEMVLSELFSEKAWARRYGISPRTVKRLRAEARERMALNVPQNISVTLFNSNREPETSLSNKSQDSVTGIHQTKGTEKA